MRKFLHRVFGHYYHLTDRTVGGHKVFACACGTRWSRGVKIPKKGDPIPARSILLIDPDWAVPTAKDHFARYSA